MMAVKEQKPDIHLIDWPVFLSADQRQKLLQGKILRAAKYIAALETCPVATQTRNSNVRPQNQGSNRQFKNC